MTKKTVSQVLSVATFAAMLYCFWLVIQFFRGQATFWPITVLNNVLPDDHRLSGSLDLALGQNGPGFVGFIFYHVAGLIGYVSLAGIVGLTGNAASRIALVGWTQYQEEQKAAAKAERARHQFKSVGELVTIRTTVTNGFLSTERFTEVETTVGVFVVDGEVGTVSKGLAVSKNGYDEIRIGGLHGRTYTLRSV